MTTPPTAGISGTEATALPRTADMPARWLRPGDRLLRAGIVCLVTRVEYTHQAPMTVTLRHISGAEAGQLHESIGLRADELVARVLSPQPENPNQAALL